MRMVTAGSMSDIGWRDADLHRNGEDDPSALGDLHIDVALFWLCCPQQRNAEVKAALRGRRRQGGGDRAALRREAHLDPVRPKFKLDAGSIIPFRDAYFLNN